MKATDVMGGAQARGGLLYPVLMIAGIAVTVFSAVGIATMLGWMPDALSGANPAATVATAPQQPAAMPQPERAGPMVPAPRMAAADPRPAAVAPATPGCANCGIIESVRPIEVKGDSTWMGAGGGAAVGALVGSQVGSGRGKIVAGAVGAGAGAYGGTLLEKELRKTTKYQIKVRMDDGRTRTFYRSNPPAFTAGQKVRVTEKGIFDLNDGAAATGGTTAGAQPAAPAPRTQPTLVKAGG
jgi:outer membrane lipoprotein SlyB